MTKFEKQIEGSALTRKNALGWVNWGLKNNYPNLLLDLYNQSPTHRACINFGVQSIIGNGVDLDSMQMDGTQVIPNYAETWDDIIKNISLDYLIYGSFALQIIKNNDNKTFSFWHMPLDKVRWSEYDEDGQITSYWICNDWTATGQYPPFQIDAFDMRDESVIERGKPYLYVYRQYSPAMTYYTQPHYQAGIKAIQSEIEYVNFDLKTTVNGFVPSGMLVMNEVETDEERQAIINNVTRMFQGSDNANSVMVTFRNNVDETKPEFIPFSTNSGNINLYDSANQRTVSRILAAHQIPNASLVGMPDVGQTGFASEADKLETAYQLYNKLTGNSNRMAVIKTVNQMFRMQGVDVEVVMKPLSFKDFDDDANVPERTESTDVDNNDSNNIEEEKKVEE
ncbi:hypothetical protein [Methanobrevibacter sp.]|uniref:hypothetical protein n=1 Tax=Methanobrevibacter sp. TaxID=66852 RepID=UPI003870CD78